MGGERRRARGSRSGSRSWRVCWSSNSSSRGKDHVRCDADRNGGKQDCRDKRSPQRSPRARPGGGESFGRDRTQNNQGGCDQAGGGGDQEKGRGRWRKGRNQIIRILRAAVADICCAAPDSQ